MARKMSKEEAKRFLTTPQGQAWLDRKITEKRAARRDPGPVPEHLSRTKFPFTATINRKQAVVWLEQLRADGIRVTYTDREEDEMWDKMKNLVCAAGHWHYSPTPQAFKGRECFYAVGETAKARCQEKLRLVQRDPA